MKTKTVEDLMIPLSEYATVSQDATMKEAVIALEKAQQKFEGKHGQHRAILVYNESNYIVGKVSQLDILRALEPKYSQIGESRSIARFGFSHKFMKSMVDQFELWDISPEQLKKNASKLKVKDFMYKPTEGEFVNKKATLGEAIHQIVMGHHQSLLVISSRQIVGILKLSDVFNEICNLIKSE